MLSHGFKGGRSTYVHQFCGFVGFRFQSLLDSMLHHPSGLLSNCDAGGHDDDDDHHLPLPDFLALLPSTRLPDDGCFLFLPLRRFVLFFLHFEGIVAPLFRFVSSSEPVSYEYQN